MEISITDADAGVGCAVLDIVAAISTQVGGPVEVLGVRFLDGDGRPVDEPCANGVTVVGFRLAGERHTPS